MHFGKITHFRKNGIGIPRGAEVKNWDILATLLLNKDLKTVYFLGDLFHSTYNSECEDFIDLLSNFNHLRFVLIEGNHDIIEPSFYKRARIEIFQRLKFGPFLLTHEWEETHLYNLSGHIHPGIKMKGKGMPSLRLPCFFFEEKKGLMPAFGQFTGLHILKPKKSDKIFIILEDKIIPI